MLLSFEYFNNNGCVHVSIISHHKTPYRKLGMDTSNSNKKEQLIID